MKNGKDEVWVPLATRIPRLLHRKLKVHVVTHDTKLMHFVVAALMERLAKAEKR